MFEYSEFTGDISKLFKFEFILKNNIYDIVFGEGEKNLKLYEELKSKIENEFTKTLDEVPTSSIHGRSSGFYDCALEEFLNYDD